MKKITIIGRGTAGCVAVTHFLRWTDWEIDWVFDPNINPQAVGEGSDLALPTLLDQNIDFKYTDLLKLNGTVKMGVNKTNWGKFGKDFMHVFGSVSGHAIHFNAVDLQNFIISYMGEQPRVKIIHKNVAHDAIDSDHIFDCSGAPKDYTDYTISDYIPVNAAYVTQCNWENARFTHTEAIAKPHGWVFGIPLTNRCAIGYLYNTNVSSLDEVKKDVPVILEGLNLVPDRTSHLQFKNYYRKKNFDKRVGYGGNASFFLEPLEATSISSMDMVQRFAYDIWVDDKDVEKVNNDYTLHFEKIETFLMLHYYAGSKFDTPFWDFAIKRGENKIKSIHTSDYKEHFIDTLKMVKMSDSLDIRTLKNTTFSVWPIKPSMKDHIYNLGIFDKLCKEFNV